MILTRTVLTLVEVLIEWIADELQSVIKSAPSNLDVDIRIFVTDVSPANSIPTLEKDDSREKGDDDNSPSDSPSESKEKLGFSSSANAPVTIKEGRPVLREILKEDISTWIGPASVNGLQLYSQSSGLINDDASVSGPETIINAVRDTLGDMRVAGPLQTLKGGPSISLHVESFSI